MKLFNTCIYYRNISNTYFSSIIIYLLLINLDTTNSKVFFNQVQISINTLYCDNYDINYKQQVLNNNTSNQQSYIIEQ